MAAPSGVERLSLATPERALLSLPIAGIGSRTLAYLIDVGLLLAGWLVALAAYSLVGQALIDVWGGLGSVARVVAVIGVFFVQWGYWTVAEVLWKGQTPGKRVLGIRVVRHDGSPVGVFESAVRNLIRVVDFLPALYPIGLATMLIDKKNRRLGDLAAGTVLVRVEKVDLSRYSAGTGAAQVNPLSAADTEVLTDFLARFDGLDPAARDRLGQLMATRFLTGLTEAERGAAVKSPAALKAALSARLPKAGA